MNAVGLVLLTRILSCLNYILPYPIVGGDWIYQWSDVGVDRRYAYTIPTHSAMWQTLQSLYRDIDCFYIYIFWGRDFCMFGIKRFEKAPEAQQ